MGRCAVPPIQALNVMADALTDAGDNAPHARKHLAGKTDKLAHDDVRPSEVWPQPAWQAPGLSDDDRGEEGEVERCLRSTD